MKTNLKNFITARAYLDSFINYEKKNKFSYQNCLKLNRVEALFAKLNINCDKLKAIHISGTKGKGSTAVFCAHLLAASGYKVGLYTSPHLFDFTERIQIITSRGASKISKKDVVKILNAFKPRLEKIRFNKKLGKVSFFEVYTAIAFKYFLDKKLDFVVLETGLGGRLDATNIITPLISVITHIGYDHTDKLGNTLPEIAEEKAGIIKKGAPVITSPQNKSVYGVIKKKCEQMGSELYALGRDFKAEKIILRKTGAFFNFSVRNNNLNNLKIYLKGKHQVENASLAVMAVLVLKRNGFIEKTVNFKKGLATAFFEGRFETICRDPLVVADVAHNPSAFSALKDSLKAYFPSKKIILIFASSRDKDVKKMLKKIRFTNIILTTFNNPRAFTQERLKVICKIKNEVIAKDIKQAFDAAKTLYKKDSLILISGSLFLVSEAKKFLQKGGRASKGQLS